MGKMGPKIDRLYLRSFDRLHLKWRLIGAAAALSAAGVGGAFNTNGNTPAGPQ